jgi:hypothetical protein
LVIVVFDTLHDFLFGLFGIISCQSNSPIPLKSLMIFTYNYNYIHTSVMAVITISSVFAIDSAAKTL